MQNKLWQCEFEAVLEWLYNHEELKNEKWAVGVSGGADSLALTYLLHDWAKDRGVKIIALTVNHGLREEAAAEAEYVASLMQKAGIEHHALVWKGEKPQKGVEEAARRARYELLREWCDKSGVSNLLIGHHKRDQAETFLMRLQRGSGVDGLAAMSPFSRWCGLNVVRPLLNVDPEDLQAYLRERNIQWVEDQSNHCDDFLRVKIRKLLPHLEESLGLSRERLVNTALEMARVRDYLEKQTEKFIKSNVRDWYGCGFSLSIEPFCALHEELGLRVLNSLLKKIGKRIYPPCLEEIERLWEAIKMPDFRGRTLSDCEIIGFQGKIWIVPELKGGVILSKQDWAEFVLAQPQLNLQRVSVPYKLKLALVQKFGF